MGLNPGAVDEELVDLMKEVGFQEAGLGVESCCDTTLRGLGKSFTKKDVLQAAKLLNKKNIPVFWYLLVGAPGETQDTLKETFKTVSRAASPWDLIYICVGIRVYKGAPIAIQMQRKDPSCTNDNFLSPVNYLPEALDMEKLKILSKRAFLKYSNFMMHDEFVPLPERTMKSGNTLIHFIAPQQPVWRLYILMRKLHQCTGISAIKRLAFEVKHRKMLRH